MSWVLTQFHKTEGNHHNSTKTAGCKHRPRPVAFKDEDDRDRNTRSAQYNTRPSEHSCTGEETPQKKGMVLEVVTTNRGFVLIPSDCFSLVLLFVRFVTADGVWWCLQTIDGASICAFVKNVCCAFQHTLISMEEIPGGGL